MNDEVIDLLADYLVALDFGAIPEQIVATATERVLDTIACAVGGTRSDAATIAKQSAPLVDLGQTAHPARWITRLQPETTVEAAGFVNSAMIRYLDFNDSVPRGGHPSDSLGPILAHADAFELSGKELITGVVAAYDAFTRCVTVTKLRERGWDQGFGVGLGVAAGVSKLLQLDRDKTRHALSIAAVSNVPLRATRAGKLSTWKGMAAAHAARSAYISTMLAADGASGPQAPIDGRHGLKEQVTGPFEFPPLEGDMRFLTPMSRLKFWPVESHLQPVVWAAIKLRDHGSIDDFESIHVATSQTGWHETGSEPDKWDPRTRETADHSLPYVFVRANQSNELNVDAFEPAAFLEEAVRPLMQKISVSVDDEIEERFAEDVIVRVTAKHKSGEEHFVEIINPRGHDKNPMTDDEVDEKFVRLVEPLCGGPTAKKALSWWRELAQADRVSSGIDLLALE